MDIIGDRAAGIDISKRDAKVGIRVSGARTGRFTRTVRTYGSTTREILRLRTDLEEARVTVVVMEATGDYWKPFFFLLEETLPLQLVNAKQARNIPGRKTDVADAAQLAAHGLLRASFIPPEPIRRLRDLTRMRAGLIHERTREYSRLEKDLESSTIKLSSLICTLTTTSARRILDVLIAGQRDPQTVAGLADVRMAKKVPALVEALTGRFSDHDGFMARIHLDRIDQIDPTISQIDDRIEDTMTPMRPVRDALATIPGISSTVVHSVIAEIGIDMTAFPTSAHLASWAGVCPGQNISAGHVTSSHTRPGNKHLKAALGAAVLSLTRSKTTYLAVKYRRIRARQGAMRATVATERALLTIIWNLLTNGEI